MYARNVWLVLAVSAAASARLMAQDAPAGSADKQVAGGEDRGYLGVGLDEVPDAVAHHLGLKGGAMVFEVHSDSPAARAGIRVHDVIAAVDGTESKSRDAVREQVRARKPGEKVKLSLRRGADSREVEVTLGSLAEVVRKAEPKGDRVEPEIAPRVELPPKEEPKEEPKTRPGFLGVGFGDVPELLAEHIGLATGTGVVVNDVWADSPAAQAKIARNDIVVAIDGYEVKGPADFTRLMAEHKVGDKVKIDYLHKGQKSSAEVTLSERPKELSYEPDEILGVPPGGDLFRLRRAPPGALRRGRVIIEGPQGKSWKLDVPDSFWKAHEFSAEFEKRLKDLHTDIEKQLGKLQQHHFDPEALSQRVKKLVEEFDVPVDGESDVIIQTPGTTSSHSSVVRIVENDIDITVKDNNGLRTVSVVQGGKKLVEDLPWDQLDKLPADVKARVEKAAGGLKAPPAAPGVKLPDSKIRA